MEALLADLAGMDLAVALRASRWGYAAINGLHVLGIALLVGAILPLDLAFLGLWKNASLETLIQVLVPMAAFGLALATAAGFLMFSIRAPEYAALPIFRLKLALITIGAGSAILLHSRHGLWLKSASPARLVAAGAISMICWLGALTAGRMIAFSAN